MLPRSLRSRGSVKDVSEQSGKDVMKLNTVLARAWDSMKDESRIFSCHQNQTNPEWESSPSSSPTLAGCPALASLFVDEPTMRVAHPPRFFGGWAAMMCATPVLNLRFASGIVHPIARSNGPRGGAKQKPGVLNIVFSHPANPAQDGAPTSWKSPANTMDVL